MKITHILNGDALHDRWPESIGRDTIIVRECLMSGPVNENDLERLFSERGHFLADYFAGHPGPDYSRDVATEFLKMRDIPTDHLIYLWFEDDLFCQINLWFVVYLIKQFDLTNSVFLIRPKSLSHWGFSGYSDTELAELQSDRIELSPNPFPALWQAYQQQDLDLLEHLATQYSDRYPFLPLAIASHRDRLEIGNGPSVLQQQLIACTNQSKDFGELFQTFSRMHPNYGLGDVQVRKLLEVLEESKT